MINSYMKILIAGLLTLVIMGGKAAAATSTPSGITVSPAFQKVSIPQDASEQPVSFTITNDKSVPQVISLSVADFNTLNETGGLFFVGSNPTDLQKKYGLANWVSLPIKDLTLQPNQTTKVNASVLNLPTLQAGGHYGALMISLSTNNSATSSNKVGLHPIASSLLFVTKLEGATYQLSLSGVNYKHSKFSLPSSIELRFQNLGNTHLIPRGDVTIADNKNHLVARGIINENSGLILPVNYRIFKVPIKRVDPTNSFGKYKLSVAYRFDGYDQYRVYQSTISLVPVWLFILIVLIFAAGLVLVVSRKARGYARKVVKWKRI